MSRAPPCLVCADVINAFQAAASGGGEGGTRITIDICAYNDVSIVDALRLGNLDADPAPRYGRWRRFTFPVPALPGGPVAAAEEVAGFPAAEFELPRVPDALSGLPSRFFYAMSWEAAPEAGGKVRGRVVKVRGEGC